MEGFAADRVGESGVVDQAVQPAAVAGEGGGQGGGGVGVGDVERVVVGGDAFGAQFLGGLPACGLVEFGDDDAVAVAADPAGRGQSQAAAGAGDDDRAGVSSVAISRG